MKNLEEKEKKLHSALSKLKNLKSNFIDLSANISNIENQKNQFKIEKEELQQKYINLNNEHQILKQKLEKANLEVMKKFENQNKFTQKIDELNQETDSLIEEIDKWQT